MQKQQSGNMFFNILLIIMFVIIGVLIYILAGGPVPRLGRTGGVQSPTNMEIPSTTPGRVISDNTGEFSDGLTNPDFIKTYPLDEFGAGVSERAVFDVDINSDGRIDRITRTRNENGTDHFYYEYKIELNQNGEYVDITPDGFRTTEGAECSLQKLQFVFRPEFRVIKISRDWSETWTTPTMARRTVYTMYNDGLTASAPTDLKVICNVVDLFQ